MLTKILLDHWECRALQQGVDGPLAAETRRVLYLSLQALDQPSLDDSSRRASSLGCIPLGPCERASRNPSDHRISEPEGVFLLNDCGVPGSYPASLAASTAWSRSARSEAQATRRGVSVMLSMAIHVRAGSVCSGSRHRISKYRFAPSDTSALCVPRPSWRPPT
eukprot:scaffold106956_cov37-Tisochrysis_lutea.AAC.1